MIEIPDPPAQPVCATCGPLLWLYSARKAAWVAFIAVAEGRHAITPHPCRHAQEPRTWREISATPGPEQARINAAGRAAVERAIKPKTAEEAS